MRTYSKDLRTRVIQARTKGQSAVEVGKRLNVSPRSVQRYWKSYCQTGEAAPKKRGGYLRSRLADHDSVLSRWIEQEPDLTLEQLCQRCRQRLKVTISLHALWYRLNRIGLSFKKNDARRRARPA